MPVPEVTWISCMELSGIFCPWPTGCEISIAPVLWPALITSSAAARAPPTTSTTASAASAGLRSRGALGSRRPAGEVGSGHTPASAPAPVPRGIVPLSLDIGPVLPWLQHLLVAQAVPMRRRDMLTRQRSSGVARRIYLADGHFRRNVINMRPVRDKTEHWHRYHSAKPSRCPIKHVRPNDAPALRDAGPVGPTAGPG